MLIHVLNQIMVRSGTAGSSFVSHVSATWKIRAALSQTTCQNSEKQGYVQPISCLHHVYYRQWLPSLKLHAQTIENKLTCTHFHVYVTCVTYMEDSGSPLPDYMPKQMERSLHADDPQFMVSSQLWKML